MRLFTSCFAVLMVLISGAAAQHQVYTEDELLRYAKSVDVAKLDSTLPSQPLEEWLLRGPARIDELYWRISLDCDLKDPKPDAEGDLPLCVKIGFRRGNTTGFGLLTVGTRTSGIKGLPELRYLDVLFPSSVGNYDKLSEFPRYLDGIAPTAMVAQTGNCVQKDNSSRPDCPRALAFFREFQSALQANKRHSVAGMIAYPLLITAHHKAAHITSERQLLAHFDEIFDRRVRCVILQATEKDVWGNWQGFTVDGGAVWFDGIIPVTEKADPTAPDFWMKYPFKIKTVNNGSEYPCNSWNTAQVIEGWRKISPGTPPGTLLQKLRVVVLRCGDFDDLQPQVGGTPLPMGTYWPERPPRR